VGRSLCGIGYWVSLLCDPGACTCSLAVWGWHSPAPPMPHGLLPCAACLAAGGNASGSTLGWSWLQTPPCSSWVRSAALHARSAMPSCHRAGLCWWQLLIGVWLLALLCCSVFLIALPRHPHTPHKSAPLSSTSCLQTSPPRASIPPPARRWWQRCRRWCAAG
jgi:hypothetical protein